LERGDSENREGSGSGTWSWDSWPALTRKVEFLRRPESYCEGATGVEAIETHMSWVFLTDRYAYKLKKPVRFQLLNLQTLEDRRRNCEAEMTWNRRLAPDIYLAVVPLALDEAGELALGGRGKVVDWLVKMRRLPSAQMLDRRIAEGDVRRADVLAVAETLAAFYRLAPRASIEPEEYRTRFLRDIGEIVHELGELSPIPKRRIAAVSQKLLGFCEKQADLVESRARDGKVVEAHGDLRPEHICLLATPVVIDCLEFDPELRMLDPADELSFLSLECELAGGAPFIEHLLLEVYSDRTADHPPRPLVRFYKAFRAFLRAKIAIWHLRDRDVTDTGKWISRTDRYLRASERLVNG
jgi:aminoglycoside phosphotransferase family enzyme